MKYKRTLCHYCGENETFQSRPLCTKCFSKSFKQTRIIDKLYDVLKDDTHFYFLYKDKEVDLEVIYNSGAQQQGFDFYANLYDIYYKMMEEIFLLKFAYFSFTNISGEMETVLTLKIWFPFKIEKEANGGVFTIKDKLQKEMIINDIIEEYGTNIIDLGK